MPQILYRLVLLCLVIAPTAVAAPLATQLIPGAAPRGARVIVVGAELQQPGITVTFSAAGGETAAAEIVNRGEQILEVVVPSAVVTGPVIVSAGGTAIRQFDFSVTPDPSYVSVASVAGGFKDPSAAVITLPDGRIFIADAQHHQIREVSPSGQVSVYAGLEKSGLKNGPRAAAQFKELRGLAYDAQRKILYVADTGNDVVRAIAPDGTVSTLAGSAKSGDRDGSGLQAEFNKPKALAVDTAGNVYVADSGNQKIRRITPVGQVTTLAAGFNAPEALCVTRAGAVIVADTRNHTIRKIEGGTITTVAGTGRSGFADGPATAAEFKEPRGVVEDDAGDLLVADTLNARIRRISRGSVTTLAGNGKTGHVDGPVSAAQFKDPGGLAYAGALFVADSKNDALRALWPEVKATALYPSSGSLRSGVVEVRVFGSGFVAGRTTVAFGTEEATVTYLSSTEVIASAPLFQAGGNIDVTVTTSAGSSVLQAAYSTDNDAPDITATVTPFVGAGGWHRPPVTVYFGCADPTSGIASCTTPIVMTQEGANQTVTGTATDLAGNTASTSATVSIDATSPTISLAPVTAVTKQSTISISGTAADALSGLNGVTCNGTPATVSGSSFTCSVTLSEGTNALHIIAADRAGNQRLQSAGVLLDLAPPVLSFVTPEEDLQVNAGSIVVDVDAGDDDAVASVTVNGSPAAFAGGFYRATVPLSEGPNTINATATDRAGNVNFASRRVSFFSVPRIAIASPADLAVVSSPTVTVSGSASGATNVSVNGTPATVSGGTFTAPNIPLVQGRTVITATATNGAGHLATANIHVYRDSLPPRVEVYSPADGQIVSQSPITVSGMVDDVAVGTINSGQASVKVNGVSATVANRAFTARNIALAPGPNVLTIDAIDQGGNAVSITRHVTLDTGASFQRIVAVSGHDQSGAIGSQLPQPLTVRLLSPSGTPVAGQAVTFRIAQNDGALSDGANEDRSLSVTSNSNGEAAVRWTLGFRSGAGNQRVEASAPGFAGKAEFSASGLTGAPDTIVVDAGNGQFGVTGERLQRPLVAIVVDKGSNRIANVPVTFTVVQGGGSIDGQNSVVVRTDSDGRAWVVPTLGVEPGIDNNIVAASVAGVTGRAAFYATGNVAGRVEDTRVSGLVVDNTNVPVAGVAVRIEGTTLTVQTDAQGTFAIEPAPVGYVKLIIDGSTADRPGTWPTLEFAMYTNAGQDNTLGMPIYILPIDVTRGLQVNEQTGGTLTLPELPGFSLTVAPGSATFPNGARSGTVSVTLVHSDKMPMPPGFGQQPRFIVTIQPTGVHFDPPAAITFPNVDGLRAGQVTEMYSFDHDLGQFVSIGTGSISEDGTTLRSDRGVGIIKGGWHCGGDPTPTGTPAACPVCTLCDGIACPADPDMVGDSCSPGSSSASNVGVLALSGTVCSGSGTCEPVTISSVGMSGDGAGLAFGTISFLARRAFSADPTADIISARVTTTPADKANMAQWSVTPVTGNVRLETPANRRGPTFSFVPDTDDHDPYVRGSGCGSPGNGSCARSTSLSYTLSVSVGSASFVRLPTQDQIDTIRQEYVNHGIDLPERGEFMIPVDTTNFLAAALDTTAYDYVAGDPGNLAERVRESLNRIIYDDVQLTPVGAPGLRVVGPGANVVTVGPLLGTTPCWPGPASSCDDVRSGSYIMSGPDGIANTRARVEISAVGLTINSTWRNPERNEAVGGVLNSRHQFGNAIDLNNLNAFGPFTAAQMNCLLETAGNMNGNGIAERFSVQIACTDATITHVHVQQ
jgi:sugar lactone lactonase YvrE